MKILANLHNESEYRTHKELLPRGNLKKKDNPILKWAKDPNRHFSKDLQIANKWP